MKTIEEAEKLMCPFISGTNRVISFNNNGYAHNVETNEAYTDISNCITNQCMAWQTTKTHEQIPRMPEPYTNGKCCASTYTDGDKLPRNKQEGFCLRLRR